MSQRLKNRIDQVLRAFVHKRTKACELDEIDPFLGDCLSEFVLRDGKRIRPIFFLIAYQGYTRRPLAGDAVISSLAFELLHDFLLVHDDIIDNSPLRRGKPTVHKLMQKHLKSQAPSPKSQVKTIEQNTVQNTQFAEKIGSDLALLVGDILYAMAIDAFMEINADGTAKQEALRQFLRATIRTGAGEYKDVINGLRPLAKINEQDICINYLWKTAEYTFKAPLVCAAILAGSAGTERRLIAKYGELLGEAFQIQDDLIGLFGSAKSIGKSVTSDVKEAKKTYPLLFAYRQADRGQRAFIDYCLGNQELKQGELQKLRRLVIDTGSRAQTEHILQQRLSQAAAILARLSLSEPAKDIFRGYVQAWFKL